MVIVWMTLEISLYIPTHDLKLSPSSTSKLTALLPHPALQTVADRGAAPHRKRWLTGVGPRRTAGEALGRVVGSHREISGDNGREIRRCAAGL